MIQRGILCIDAECALCRRLAARWGPALRRAGIRLAALQAPWVQRRLGLAGGVPEEMKLLLPDGRILGGATALVELAAVLAWPRPLVRAARLRPASALLGAAYRWVARHRHCSAGGCRLQG